MKSKARYAWRFAIVLATVPLGVPVVASAEEGAHEEIVARQFQQSLPNVPGMAFTTLLVTFPPGARAAPHRHGRAFVYAYVLQGSVRSGLDDSPPKVYRTGQDWSEPPGAHHVLTENVSSTKPARLLVVFVATSGEALKVPDPR